MHFSTLNTFVILFVMPAELAGQQQNVHGMLVCCLGFGDTVCNEWPINQNIHAEDKPEKKEEKKHHHINPD